MARRDAGTNAPLILEADPEMIEERKWKKPSNPLGVPGLVARRHRLHRRDVQERREAHVRAGRQLPDPSRLFNSSLEGNTRRAIDIHEGEEVDAGAFKALMKAAVAQNGAKAKKEPSKAQEGQAVVLLSGGNPQIAKADGDAPVQAYIAAMPGWKRDSGSASTRSSCEACPTCGRP